MTALARFRSIRSITRCGGSPHLVAAVATVLALAPAAWGESTVQWVSDQAVETPDASKAAAAPPAFDLLAPLSEATRAQQAKRTAITQAAANEPVARVAVASGAARAIAENGAPRALPLSPAPEPVAQPAPTSAPIATGVATGPVDDGSTITLLPTVLQDDAVETLPQTPEPLEPPAAPAPVRRFQPIGELSVNTALPAGLLPTAQQDEQLPVAPYAPVIDDDRRLDAWSIHNVHWAATNMRHRPLYFEEVNLERYGYTIGPCVQPIISGAHFFLVVPALPYKIAVAPQDTCQYTLGDYRPGDCVPRCWHRPQCGTDGAGAVAEAATAVALVFLIP
ncbi:MAG: hypothetical protein KDA44_18805 [Planctomycetales bacterium]|nr:hypothetical protein [Planctomycetales bacterium]